MSSKEEAIADLDAHLSLLKVQYQVLWDGLDHAKITSDARLAALARVGMMIIRSLELKLDALEVASGGERETRTYQALVNEHMKQPRVVVIQEVQEEGADGP